MSGFRNHSPAAGPRSSVQKVGGGSSGVLLKDPDVTPPLAGDDGAYREPVFRDVDGRGQGLGQGEGPVLLQEGRPTGQGSRNGDGAGASVGNVVQPQGPDGVGGSQGTGSTAGIQTPQPLLPGRPEEGEDVTAHPRHVGLHHVQHGCRGDGGIEGVSTVLEDLQGSCRCQGLAGGRHPVGGIDRGSSGQGGGTRRRSVI